MALMKKNKDAERGGNQSGLFMGQSTSGKEMKCPICGAMQYKGGNNFVEQNGGWLCKTCYNPFADEEVEIKQECESIYTALQFGKFDEVLSRVRSLRTRLEDDENGLAEMFAPWMDYIECRAEFRVLGPIIDARGNSTGCFTPCNIDIFSPKKLKASRFAENFGLGKEDNGILGEIAEDMIYSAATYTRMLQGYKEDGKLNNFDIFICHKTDDAGGHENTPDYKLGKQMYKALSKRYKVFFAPETKKTQSGLKRLGEFNNNWRSWIYEALLTSRIMIVIGTKSEYVLAPNVQNEWVTFYKFMDEGFYGEKHILPVFQTQTYGGQDCSRACLNHIYGTKGIEQENYFDAFVESAKKDKLKLNANKLLQTVEAHLEKINKKGKKTDLFDNKEMELWELAKSVETAGNEEEAVERYRYLWTRYRNNNAAVRLGMIYSRVSTEKGYQWFVSADSKEGQAHRAFCLYHGRGCKKDQEKAFDILDDNDSFVAIYYKALCFAHTALFNKDENDDTIWKDVREAKRAVDDLGTIIHKFYPAQCLYGLCVYQGIGAKKSKRVAREILETTKDYRDVYSELFEEEE